MLTRVKARRADAAPRCAGYGLDPGSAQGGVAFTTAATAACTPPKWYKNTKGTKLEKNLSTKIGLANPVRPSTLTRPLADVEGRARRAHRIL